MKRRIPEGKIPNNVDERNPKYAHREGEQLPHLSTSDDSAEVMLGLPGEMWNKVISQLSESDKDALSLANKALSNKVRDFRNCSTLHLYNSLNPIRPCSDNKMPLGLYLNRVESFAQEQWDDIQFMQQEWSYYIWHLIDGGLSIYKEIYAINSPAKNLSEYLATEALINKANHLMIMPFLLFGELSGKNLTRFPVSVLNDPGLADFWSNTTSLDLSHNRLRSVPEELSRLPKLSVLELSHNKLVVAPKLKTMKTLEGLFMCNNQLRSLEWGKNLNLPNLKALDIGENCLPNNRALIDGLPKTLTHLLIDTYSIPRDAVKALTKAGVDVREFPYPKEFEQFDALREKRLGQKSRLRI